MCTHLNCPFYCLASDSCDYLLVTGHCRPAPSNVCDKYKTDFTGEDRPLSFRALPGGVNEDVLLRLEAKFVPGIDSRTLSRLANVDSHYTQRWIRRVHPEERWSCETW